MTFGNEKGDTVAIIDTKQGPQIVCYLRNLGHSPAKELAVEPFLLTAPPTTGFIYPPIEPGGTGHFLSGPTLGPEQSIPEVFAFKPLLTAPIVAKIRTGEVSVRVVVRIRYYDEFADYCEGFAFQYNLDPAPGFYPALPPSPAICKEALSLKEQSGEQFIRNTNGTVGVTFTGSWLSDWRNAQRARPRRKYP